MERNEELQPHELKVSSKSNPNNLAGAIAKVYKEHGKCVLICIGAGPVNQAIKAIGRARGYAAPAGLNLGVIPSYSEVVIDENTRTSIRLEVVNVPQSVQVETLSTDAE